MICRLEWLAGRRIFHRLYLTLSLYYRVVARHSWGVAGQVVVMAVLSSPADVQSNKSRSRSQKVMIIVPRLAMAD